MKKNDIKKKRDYPKIITLFVFWSLLISIIFVVIRIFLAPNTAVDDATMVKSDYVLMLIQCFLGIFSLLLPSVLTKKFKIQIPSSIYLLFIIFLYCAIFLGEVNSFYYNIPYWDTILHAFSGGMLGALGFSIISLFNDNKDLHFELSPLFVALFAFCFSITLGVVWEMYEYTFDGLLSINMQKFALEDGTMLVGREALRDTMEDFIVNGVGAMVMSVLGYLSLKRKTSFFNKLIIRKS